MTPPLPDVLELVLELVVASARQAMIVRPTVIASQSRRTRPPMPRNQGQTTTRCGRVIGRRLRVEQEIAPVAPVVEEAVEVALAEPIAFCLGQRASSHDARGAPAGSGSVSGPPSSPRRERRS